MENPERVTYFAATDSRGKHIPFGIKSKDRDRHMYVIGKTGMGKSTLLENMAIQDIRNGEGIAVIDPHGSFAERLLDYIPEDRIKDVVYFAPFDLEHPIAFNVMEDVGYDRRHLVVSGLMATFKKIWEDAWSARMEYILTNTILALLEYPDATLLGVNRMYTDKDYRTKVVDNVKDPVVKDFWTKEFANYGDRYTQEATPAIQNKIGQFTGNPLIRNIIGQAKSSFDIRELMDNKKILIMNLSKGLVGETNMRLLGSMLVTRIFLAAMSRAGLPANELARSAPMYFYVDEFQNFANQTFAEILSEARKYKLNLVIAHQYIEQMEEEVRDAVFGNVGTTVAFRVGPLDAEVLEPMFLPKFTKEDIGSLDRRQIYLSLMIDGVGSPAFSAVTLPPIEAPPISYREQVLESSHEQFTVARQSIEESIMKEFAEAAAAPAPQDARMRGKKVVPAPLPLKAAGSISAPDRAPSVPALPAASQIRAFSPRPPLPRPVQLPRPRTEEHKPAVRTPAPTPVPSRPLNKPVANKTPEDLKAILRTMTAKTGQEREVKKAEQDRSLKGALANVLEKSNSTPRPPQGVNPEPRPSAPPPRPEETKRPFEVSEETLRKVLRGES